MTTVIACGGRYQAPMTTVIAPGYAVLVDAREDLADDGAAARP